MYIVEYQNDAYPYDWRKSMLHNGNAGSGYESRQDALAAAKKAEAELGFLYRVVGQNKKKAPTPSKTVTQAHYASLSPEPMSVIHGWGLSYSRGNALKYIARAGKKDATTEGTIKDLEKAITYLKWEINALRGNPGW